MNFMGRVTKNGPVDNSSLYLNYTRPYPEALPGHRHQSDAFSDTEKATSMQSILQPVGIINALGSISSLCLVHICFISPESFFLETRMNARVPRIYETETKTKTEIATATERLGLGLS